MIEQLVSRVFAIRNAAHVAHWATRIYARHVALGDFYDGVVDKTDAIVEAYQGLFGLIKEVPALHYPKGDILKRIGEDARWIEDNRDAISKEHCVLENLLDDLGALYSTTYYKLKFLE